MMRTSLNIVVLLVLIAIASIAVFLSRGSDRARRHALLFAPREDRRLILADITSHKNYLSRSSCETRVSYRFLVDGKKYDHTTTITCADFKANLLEVVYLRENPDINLPRADNKGLWPEESGNKTE